MAAIAGGAAMAFRSADDDALQRNFVPLQHNFDGSDTTLRTVMARAVRHNRRNAVTVSDDMTQADSIASLPRVYSTNDAAGVKGNWRSGMLSSITRRRNPRAIPYGSRRQMSAVFKEDVCQLLTRVETQRLRAGLDDNPAMEYAVNQRKLHYHHLMQVRTTIAMVILSIAGVFSMIMENEVKWNNNLEPDVWSSLWKGFNTISSIGLGLLLWYYYELRLKSMKVVNLVPPTANMFRLPFVRRAFLLELFVVIFHIPIFLDVSGTWSYKDQLDFRWDLDFAGIFQFARLYLIIRLFVLINFLNTPTGRFVARLNNQDVTSEFALRAIFDRNPILVILVLEICLIFISAFAMHLVERPFNVDNDYSGSANQAYFWNSFWLLCVTVTTVGYGDQYPVTPVGRMIAVATAMVGILLTALQVAMVSRKLTLSKSEERIVSLLRSSKWKSGRVEIAASLIQSAFRFHMAIKRKMPHATLERLRYTLYEKKRIFRECIRSEPNGFEGELRQQFMLEDMYSALKELETVMEEEKDKVSPGDLSRVDSRLRSGMLLRQTSGIMQTQTMPYANDTRVPPDVLAQASVPAVAVSDGDEAGLASPPSDGGSERKHISRETITEERPPRKKPSSSAKAKTGRGLGRSASDATLAMQGRVGSADSTMMSRSRRAREHNLRKAEMESVDAGTGASVQISLLRALEDVQKQRAEMCTALAGLGTLEQRLRRMEEHSIGLSHKLDEMRDLVMAGALPGSPAAFTSGAPLALRHGDSQGSRHTILPPDPQNVEPSFPATGHRVGWGDTRTTMGSPAAIK